MSSPNVLVVARWREDLDWLEHVPAGWVCSVVQKRDAEDGPGDVPNVGREPASFLWWITRGWDDIAPAALYGFVQGDPFPHCPDLLGCLERAAARGVDGFEPLAGDRSHPLQVLSDGVGNPHHAGLPVAFWYEKWLGRPFPGEVGFWAGGQFVVTGEALLGRPRRWYERVLDDVVSRPDPLPWVLERLWPVIFGGEQ